MNIFFYVFILLAVLVALALLLLSFRPRTLATVLRYLPAVLVGLLGLLATLAGRGIIGVPLLVFGSALFRRAVAASRATRRGGGRSHVRSAALEMELDLDTGEMNGLVLAGSLEGSELNALGERDLTILRGELLGDPESLSLLEAYLDRRIPGWRGNADAEGGAGLGAAPGSGTMTEQEAYQILGLGPGAGKTEIRDAHRRLMKRMHPDAGGSEFLAGRINEAKEVLLRRHG